MTKYRIGIDVGGTFTHAVALDSETLQVVGQIKVPTTHKAQNGVAQGIVESLQQLLCECSINAQDVKFIAHSTTQATNALLEGDVSDVGIIAVGKGLEGKRVKNETDLGDINLDNHKKIKVRYDYLDSNDFNETSIETAVKKMSDSGVGAIVAAEAFSVEDPKNEDLIVSIAMKNDIPAVATHDISGLYGLRMRTKTAAINASIMPKMLATASATQRCVKDAGINVPLMIMRSDGGVMNIDEMMKRPILTILSGPAAGIAAALLYVKISNGIFLEVGGTSTDIAVIKNGRAQIKSAEIGGHKVYLRTLDSRTVGVAGGSLPRIENKSIVDVGPRSAHIAGLAYSSFSKSEDVENSKIIFFQPDKNDPKGYFSLNGKYAVTTTCAANSLGLVKHSDYAFGNKASADIAIQILETETGSKHVSEVSEKILKLACAKVIKVVDKLISDYKLDKSETTLVGGGGGAAAIVPFTARETGMKYNIAENHAVISAIGAALAMVTDTVERSVINPTDKDVVDIRRAAEDAVKKMGASADTIEVVVEIDQQKNILRATATGTTELRRRDLLLKEISPGERKRLSASSLKVDPSKVELNGSTGYLEVFQADLVEKTFFGLISNSKRPVRVLDREGIIRFVKGNAMVVETATKDALNRLEASLEKTIKYNDAGEKIPGTYIVYKDKIIDFSGLLNRQQVISLYKTEAKNFEEDQKVVIILEV